MKTHDDDVLNDLRAMLDVAPPTGLESRVMRRILDEELPRQRVWIGTALVAALAAVVVLLLLPARPPQPTDRHVATASSDLPASSSLPRALPMAETKEAAQPRRATAVLAATRRRPDVSDVLVPTDQARHFQTFVAAVAAGRVQMAPPRQEPNPEIQVLPLAPTEPVVIQAMAIEPLSADVSQTEWR